MALYKNVVAKNNMLVNRLAECTGLDRETVNNVIAFTKCLEKPTAKIVERPLFSAVLNKYFKINDRMLHTSIYEKERKKNLSGLMSGEDFAKIICIYLTYDIDAKIDYVFTIYDANGDGLIDNMDVRTFIKSCKCVGDTDESEKDDTFIDLLHIASDLLGLTPDTPVDLEAFRIKARENSLMLGILCECLPHSGVLDKFRKKVEGRETSLIRSEFASIRQELLFDFQSKGHSYYPLILDMP